MKTKRIIICGLGNVGKTFMKLLSERTQQVEKRYGLKIEVGGVVDIGGAAVTSEGGLPLSDFLSHIGDGGKPESFGRFGKPGLTGVETINGFDFDILVETTPTNLKTGEPANSFVTAALKRGIDVVSANKGPFVLFFDRLKQLSASTGGRLFISAATGAALPTLDVGKYSTAGAGITMIEGILNGTTNFILTKMAREKTSYADALREAQAMGIAESDPSLDVEGYDSRNKIVLITNTLFDKGYGISDVPVRGITEITRQDIERGVKEGKVLKLVAEAAVRDDGEVVMTVGPKYLAQNHPLAAINFSEKGITYHTDTMGQITVFGGKSSPLGAAAALLKDIVHAHLFSGR